MPFYFKYSFLSTSNFSEQFRKQKIQNYFDYCKKKFRFKAKYISYRKYTFSYRSPWAVFIQGKGNTSKPII